jgi:hypothetical protein
MAMNDDAVKETFDELFTLLEALETQSAAILQCLRDQGITPDEKLGPYLEQAGKASNVKWRAARMRMEYLFSPTKKGVTGATEKKEPREDGDKGENEDKQAKHAESQTKEDRAAEKQKVAKANANQQPDATTSNAESNEKSKVERNTQSQNK